MAIASFESFSSYSRVQTNVAHKRSLKNSTTKEIRVKNSKTEISSIQDNIVFPAPYKISSCED